jgi:hypothetical protein
MDGRKGGRKRGREERKEGKRTSQMQGSEREAYKSAQDKKILEDFMGELK